MANLNLIVCWHIQHLVASGITATDADIKTLATPDE